MKNYEVESLVKSFSLFFVLISLIYALFLWQSYTSKKHQLDTHILQEMKLFTYDPTSDRFSVEFVPPTESTKLITVYHSDKEVYGFFKVPTMDDYLMRVALPIEKYKTLLSKIRFKAISGTLWYLLLIAAISLLLAYYSLQPIRRALRINKEFMKDILHDVNTPIASIVINLKLLQKRFGKHSSMERIENNIETLGMLRENIHAYLGEREEELSQFGLKGMVDEKLEYFRTLYPQLVFENRLGDGIMLNTRKRAFVRIMDNIIGNAAKYNKPQGSVTIDMDGDNLSISDTGRGIENVHLVFKRHYKEGERGMGLGLHIVQNITKKLKIGIKIESQLGM